MPLVGISHSSAIQVSNYNYHCLPCLLCSLLNQFQHHFLLAASLELYETNSLMSWRETLSLHSDEVRTSKDSLAAGIHQCMHGSLYSPNSEVLETQEPDIAHHPAVNYNRYL